MCGICGRYNFDRKRAVGKGVLRQMTRALARRGPDGEGFFFSGHVGLASRRLSLVGGGEGGAQPFYNETGSVGVVYNGEIYNHEQLRRELRGRGHVLKGACDGEVIAHLYEEHAEDFFGQMQGMFAVALYDREKDLLFLSRDRMGIKPLFYGHTQAGLVFSSSLRALLLDDDVPHQIDPQALQHYLAYNYFPEDITPFAQVRKLKPGHYMAVDRQGVRLRRYWAVPERDGKGWSADVFDGQFHDVFKQAVKRHLVADVPVGVLLSGGVDSSYLAHTVNEVAGQVTTFTIGFRETSFDERPYARQVARELGACHHEIEISQDIPSAVRRLACSMDLPIGEPSFFPTFELAAYVKQHCGVVLSGEGADELFLGYETYQADRFLAFLFMLPQRAREVLLKGIARLFFCTESRLSLRFRAELIARVFAGNRELMHYGWREVFSADERGRLCLPGGASSRMPDDVLDLPGRLFLRHIRSASSGNYVDRSNLFDLNVWLPDGILQRVDMASMHHGLEVRVPFLDDDIVKMASRLSRDVLLRGMQGKYALKKMLWRKIPLQILNRPKQGFSVPVGGWLRHGLDTFYNDVLDTTLKTGGRLFAYDYLRTLLKEHRAGKRDRGRQLWCVLMYILWYDSLGGER